MTCLGDHVTQSVCVCAASKSSCSLTEEKTCGPWKVDGIYPGLLSEAVLRQTGLAGEVATVMQKAGGDGTTVALYRRGTSNSNTSSSFLGGLPATITIVMARNRNTSIRLQSTHLQKELPFLMVSLNIPWHS